MTGRKLSLALFSLAAVVSVAADLISKYAVFDQLGPDSPEPFVLIPGWLQFNTAINPGGLWSLGAGFGASMNFWLTCFAATAAIAITAWACFTIRAGQKLTPIVLGAILGGALGNLYDRLVYAGVRDFIQVHYQHVWYFPTFNVADSCLVCGALFLLAASFFTREARPAEAAPSRRLPAPEAEKRAG
jgi:signal peptidase II